jgi:hypothetical protein
MKCLVTGDIRAPHRLLIPHIEFAPDFVSDSDPRIVAVMIQRTGKVLLQAAFVAMYSHQLVVVFDTSSGKEIDFNSMCIGYEDISAITTHKTHLVWWGLSLAFEDEGVSRTLKMVDMQRGLSEQLAGELQRRKQECVGT